jgi:putative transposase
MADKNFKNFFASIRSYKVNSSKFKARPRLPKYKDKTNGKFVAIYEKNAINKKKFNQGLIKLSGTNIEIRTQIKDFNSIKEAKVVPTLYGFKVCISYEKEAKPLNPSRGRVASIDLGLNNLATVTFLDGSKPLIFNGKPLKSMTQYYNKVKASLQSKLPNNRKTSKRIRGLTPKRNNKIDNYLHKTSKMLVNQLVSKDIDCLVIGNNVRWKQDINIGRVNNQNFVSIPHSKFISLLRYKCEMEGIDVKITEESYTSKCSFLDLEEVKKHETYLGKRVKRGLFKASNGRIINADVNGSYNIMRKVIPEAFTLEGIEGFAVIPSRMTVSFSQTNYTNMI